MQAKFIGIRRVKKERSVEEDPKKCADDRSYGQREYCALNLVIDDLEVKSTVIYSCILGSLCRDVFLALLIFDQEDLFILLDLCVCTQSSLDAAAPLAGAAGLASTVSIV